MAKSKPSDDTLASFCWQHDASNIKRMLEVAQKKLEGFGLDAAVASAFPRSERPLGNFNEASLKKWIESILSGDDQDVIALQSLAETCRIRLGYATERPASADSDIKLVRREGSGLYGVVWEGSQETLKRKVAVKVIKPSMANTASAVEYARALARLQHENVVTVHQVTKVVEPESSEVVDAVIMEWLEGKTLGERLSGPRFPVEDAQNILNSLIRGVKHMHSQDLMHGDLHAGNVIITNDSVKIIDMKYAEADSMARLSSAARATQIQSDIESLRFLFRRVMHHSDADVQIVGTYESRLNDARSLDDVEAVVGEIFSRLHSGDRSGKSDTSFSLEELQNVGLEQSDAMVLKLAGEKVLAGEHYVGVINVADLVVDLGAEGITSEDIEDSIELLHEKGFITTDGIPSRFVQLSTVGFSAYLQSFHESYVDDWKKICSSIVIDKLKSDVEIAKRVGLPRPLVLNVLDVLAMENLCKVRHSNSGTTILHVSVELCRRVGEK